MNLKNSLFEKGLIKADLRRFGIFSALYAALIFFSTFFDFYVNDNIYTKTLITRYVNSQLFANSYFSHVCAVGAGALLAVVLFWFLNSSSALSFYHGLPLKRRKIYFSKLLTAFILLTVPVIIVSVIVFLTKLFGSDINVRLSHLFIWTGIQLLYSYMSFACITFTAMFTGSLLSHAAISLICFAFPAVAVSFTDSLTGNFLYGYSGSIGNILSYIYLMPPDMASKRCIIYIAAIAVLLTLSYFIYKNRDLERNGEAFVFKTSKNIFVAAAALFGGIFSYWYFSIWFKENIFWMLPFGLIALIIANMVNKRSLTLKGVPLYAGIFLACVLIVFGGFKFDILGYQNRVPDINRVLSVSINKNDYALAAGYDPKTGSELFEKNPEKAEITAHEDILKVINFHNYRIKNRYDISHRNSINIDYTLKNGRHLKRYYYFDHNADKEYTEPVSKIDKWVKNRYFPYENANAKITSFVIGSMLQNVDSEIRFTVSEDNEYFGLLKEALEKDIKALPYDEDSTLYNGEYYYVGAPAYISVHFTTPLVYADGSNYTGTRTLDRENTYCITDGFTNTLAVLHSIEGFADIEFTPDKVKRIGVRRFDEATGNFKEPTETLEDSGSYFANIGMSEIITDRAKIETIVNYALHEYKYVNDENGVDYYFELNNDTYFSWNGKAY